MEEVDEELPALDFSVNSSLAIHCGLGITNNSVAIVQVGGRAACSVSNSSKEKKIITCYTYMNI